MAIENKRVIDLANESTSLAGDEYVLLDSNNAGTTKYRLSRLSDQIEDVDEAVQAEATARANAVTAEATARTNADTTLQGNITAEASTRAAADTALEGEITNLKDDLSGLESDGVVASAEQLLSDNYTVDQVPYHYRASGGNGADREFDEIVGGTVNWNQLLSIVSATNTSNGVTFTSSNGTITANGTASGGIAFSDVIESPLLITNHVVYFCGCPSDGSDSKYFIDTGANIGRDYGNGRIARYTGTTTTRHFRFYVVNGSTVTNIVAKPQCFDLTAMFGATIADYIYSLEQSSAGAGKEFFRKLFPKDYYEYNAGTLRSVEGLQSHEMVGFNQWDEEWEVGNIDSDGQPMIYSGYFRSKNFIPVLPDTYYYFKSSDQLYIYGYDESHNFVGLIVGYALNIVKKTPSNCHFIKFVDVARNAYNHDICISISSDRNGEYEHYEKHSYPLDSTLTLRGIPKLDASNNLYYDGDTYAADGTVTRKYGIVDLGTLNWYNAGDMKLFYSNGLASEIRKAVSNNEVFSWGITSIGHEGKSYREIGTSTPYAICASTSGNFLATLDISTAYADLASFKTAMSGVMLVYELATPTTETAEPYAEVQNVDPYGTEEYVSTSIVPIGHYTKYPENLRAKLENLDLSMIAPIETGTTASQAYAVGKYFLLNNKFCKAKTAIASGATFTLNTNYEVTTVADELYTALHS